MKQEIRKALGWSLTILLGIVGGLALVALLEWMDERKQRKKTCLIRGGRRRS